MKLTDKYSMSYWAYEQCKNNDNEEIRDIIQSEPYIYCYCLHIKNRRYMREKLKGIEYWKDEYNHLCELAGGINEINR